MLLTVALKRTALQNLTRDGWLFLTRFIRHQGSGAGPGSAWNQPDARTLEYRLYYQAGDQVYTDSILHAFEVQSDDVVWNAPM
jgi:hypothetical protein